MTETSQTIISIILAIPNGSVRSYGSIAREAGLPNGARQVARILHSCGSSQGLPWWRVVRSDGRLALDPLNGGDEQLARLKAEGWCLDDNGRLQQPMATSHKSTHRFDRNTCNNI